MYTSSVPGSRFERLRTHGHFDGDEGILASGDQIAVTPAKAEEGRCIE